MGTAINSEVFTFEFGALPKDGPRFYVAKFEGTEALNSLFQFDIVLLCKDADINTKELIGTKATFKIRRNKGEDAVFPGYISEMEMTDRINGYCYYIVSLSPSFAKYKLIVDSAVFMDKNLKETLDMIMGKNKFFSVEHEFRFTGTYPKKEFAMQFEESCFDYMLWRLEEQGAYFYFDKTGERIIFSDNPRLHDKSQGTVYYSPGTGLEINVADEIINTFDLEQSMLPARVAIRTYDWKNPNEPIVGIAEVSKAGFSDVYLPDEAVDSKGEAERIARIRAEQILAGHRIFRGSSSVPFFRPGVVFTLAMHETEKFNRDYLITKIKHEGRQETLLNFVCKIPIDSGDSSISYRNTFECIETDTKYRAPRTYTRKPVYGAIHGFIAGDGSGNSLIDKYGRYKVLFAFDISGRSGGNTSCWIRRAQEQVGKDFGLAFPLKAGTEVIITFVEGNADLPIISGALANGETGSISGGGNTDFSGIKTDGGPQLTFNNKKNLIQLSNLSGSEIRFGSGSQDYMLKGTHIGLQSASVGTSSLAGAASESVSGFVSRAYTECGNWYLYLMGALAAATKTGQGIFEGLSEKNADPNVTPPDWGESLTKLIPLIRTVIDYTPYNAVISASQKNTSSTLQCFPSTAELVANFILMIGGSIGSIVTDAIDVKKGEEITGTDTSYDVYPKDAALSHKIVGQVVTCLPELAIILLMLKWKSKLSKGLIGGILIDSKDKNITLHARSYIGIHADRGFLLNAYKKHDNFIDRDTNIIQWGSPREYSAEKDLDPSIGLFFDSILNESTWELGKATIKDTLTTGHVNRKPDPNQAGFLAEESFGDPKLGVPAKELKKEEASNSFIVGTTNLYYLNCAKSYYVDFSYAPEEKQQAVAPGNNQQNVAPENNQQNVAPGNAQQAANPVKKKELIKPKQAWVSSASRHLHITQDPYTYLDLESNSVTFKASRSINVTYLKKEDGQAEGEIKANPHSKLTLGSEVLTCGVVAKKPQGAEVEKLTGFSVSTDEIRLAVESDKDDAPAELLLTPEIAEIALGKGNDVASLLLTSEMAFLEANIVFIADLGFCDSIEPKDGVLKIGDSIKITTQASNKYKELQNKEKLKEWITEEEKRLKDEDKELKKQESEIKKLESEIEKLNGNSEEKITDLSLKKRVYQSRMGQYTTDKAIFDTKKKLVK